MPGRNINKEFVENSYYHIYSRGVAKQKVFLDKDDYEVFLSLLKRYLSVEQEKCRARGLYPTYANEIELISYCLMPNHIHMFIHQKTKDHMSAFMKSVMVSYCMYYNRKYKRVGPVFQSRYRASRITQDEYFIHISRYIHLNPKGWRSYPYSSLRYYTGDAQANWIKPNVVLSQFKDKYDYLAFLADYEDYKQMMDEIKWDIATP